MRVHVISDMEGVSGIVKWQQTTGGDPMYEEGRRLYTEEINAAVRGAKAAGATEIVSAKPLNSFRKENACFAGTDDTTRSSGSMASPRNVC